LEHATPSCHTSSCQHLLRVTANDVRKRRAKIKWPVIRAYWPESCGIMARPAHPHTCMCRCLSMAILKRLSLLADPIAIDASFPTALPSWLQGGAFILPWLFVSWGLPSSSNPVPPTFPARKSELPFPVHSLTLKEKYNDVSGSPTVAVPFQSRYSLWNAFVRTSG
jgi:hypothetical protein